MYPKEYFFNGVINNILDNIEKSELYHCTDDFKVFKKLSPALSRVWFRLQ